MLAVARDGAGRPLEIEMREAVNGRLAVDRQNRGSVGELAGGVAELAKRLRSRAPMGVGGDLGASQSRHDRRSAARAGALSSSECRGDR